MQQDFLNVRLGNQRRKKALAALQAQVNAGRAGTAAVRAGSTGGGLGRGQARTGLMRGAARGIPPGLEALYARAAGFARANSLDSYSLNAEQQPGAPDPGEQAASYAAANAPAQPQAPVADPGGLAPGSVVPASGSGNPFTGGAPGGIITTDPEHNAAVLGKSDVDPFAIGGSAGAGTPSNKGSNPFAGATIGGNIGGVSGGLGPRAYTDGQAVNGGIYYQGTVIPFAVWRAMQLGL